MPGFRLAGLGFSLAAFVNSLWIFHTYLSITLIGAFEPASFARVLELTADRPYINRILIPCLTRLLSFTVPPDLIDWLNTAPAPLSDTFKRLAGGIYPREAALVLTIMFLSLVGFALAERVLLADLGFRKRQLFVLPLFIQGLILPVNLFTGYYYDLPQLFLTTICLIHLRRRNWGIYLFFLCIANLNKETSALLLLVYCIYFWPRLTRGAFFRLLAIQVLLTAAIRFSTLLLFGDNEGQSLVFTLPDQFKIYSEHPLALVFTIAYFGVVLYLVLRHWRSKNRFLRAASIIGLAILSLFIPFGYPLEFRIFLDALPAIGILIFPPNFIKA